MSRERDGTTNDDIKEDVWTSTHFLEKVTSVVPGVIYVFNQQTQSNEYANRSLPETLGYSGDEIRELGDAMMVELCHPDDLPLVGAHFEAIRGLPDGEFRQVEYRMRHRDGHDVHLLSVDTVFDRDEDGNVRSHIGTATDITSMKEADLARQRAAVEIEHHVQEVAAANEELTDFAYAASHDLKSPINTLQVIIEEIRAELGPQHELTTTLIDPALAVAGRARSLVEDVLHYTRVIGQPTEPEEVDLSELARDARDDLFGEVGEVGEVEIVIGDLPTVIGDPVQLRLLLGNLVSNAVKFRRPSVDHRVELGPVHDGGGQTGFWVTDNGIGIAEDRHQQIFGVFQRLNLASDFAGTGLGLALCRRVVHNHAGALHVESTVGQGTTFTVTLPEAPR